jgi:hypothetical protein
MEAQGATVVTQAPEGRRVLALWELLALSVEQGRSEESHMQEELSGIAACMI